MATGPAGERRTGASTTTLPRLPRARRCARWTGITVVVLALAGCGQAPAASAVGGSPPAASMTATRAPGTTATVGTSATTAAAGTPATAAGPSAAPATGQSTQPGASTTLPSTLGTPRPTRRPAVPVPTNLTPSLADARTDSPPIYSDGCHLGFLQTDPGTCAFGDPQSDRRVVLFGDSLAGQWFPALESLASANHWRLESLTKSACPAADVTPWNSALGRAYSECDTWRQNVLSRIAAEHPAAVVISEDRLYQLSMNGKPVPVANALPTWYAGLAQTLHAVEAGSSETVLIGATPRARVDPPTCLAKHPADMLACATPASIAIDQGRLTMDHQTASVAGASFVDPSPWVCPSDPCLPVLGTTLVYREVDHLTATFAEQLAPNLAPEIRVP